MTDAELQGIALQALNMGRVEQERDRFNFILASYHEGQGLHRMTKFEADLISKLGEAWLSNGTAKDIGFGLIRYCVAMSPPDAIIFVTSANGYKPTAKFHALPLEQRKEFIEAEDMHRVRQAVRDGLFVPEDVMWSVAQTPDRVCHYTQPMPFGSEPPQISFFAQADFSGRMKFFGADPQETLEMVRQRLGRESVQ